MPWTKEEIESYQSQIEEKEKRQIKAVRLHKKQTRKKSRQKAVCHICKKDTFTSEKQLNVHINAKHSK